MQCVHFTHKLASRAHIYFEHAYKQQSHSNITIYYLFHPPVSHSSHPWEEPGTISYRESVLYCSITGGSTTSSCSGYSATIRTSTPSHYSCYCTCEYSFTHTCAYTHTQRDSPSREHIGMKWPAWQSYFWFFSDSWLLVLHLWVSFFIAGGYFV